MMNIALWIVQGLLALLFVLWGVLIATLPKEKQHGKWAADFSEGQLRLIGLPQFLGGLGLLLPALTGILPWLTPFAALGLALFMAAAIVAQFIRRWDGSNIVVMCAVVLLMTLFVAYGRFIMVPLA